MPYPEPKTGLVIRYSYLWRDEAKSGRDEGVKDRPCVILSARKDKDAIIVTVLPITHTPPDKEFAAVEIPAASKARLGLDEQRSWIVTHEANRFTWPGCDLRPVSRKNQDYAYGSLPHGLLVQAHKHFLGYVRQRQFHAVMRDDIDRDTSRSR